MVNVFPLKLGYTGNAYTEFFNRLKERVRINEVTSIQACDITLAFCPIVSRVGTDIEAAIKNIPDTDKPVFLVVLHHTFDRDYVVPNTRRFVQRKNVTTLDFLFSDEGLLACSQNDAAIATVMDILWSMQPALPGVPHVQNNPEWLEILLSLWCLLLPLTICLLIWDSICDLWSNSPPIRRPAPRNRFSNGYVLLLTALLLWLVVIKTTFEMLSLLSASDIA